LYLPISVSNCSVGMTPASLFLVAFTITMTFIVRVLSLRRPGRRFGCYIRDDRGGVKSTRVTDAEA
jgi:hypothetical protein